MECITALCLSLLWQSARKRLHFSLIALAKSDAPRESSSAQKMKVFLPLNFITSNRVSAITSSTLTRQDPHLIWKNREGSVSSFCGSATFILPFQFTLVNRTRESETCCRIIALGATPVQSKPAKMTKIFGFLFNLQQSGEDKTFPSLGWKPTTMTFFAHLSLPWSIVPVALSFLGCCRRRPTMVTPDQISTLFNIYRPYTNPVSPNTKQYQAILTQYHQLPTSTAQYWPSINKN